MVDKIYLISCVTIVKNNPKKSDMTLVGCFKSEEDAKKTIMLYLAQDTKENEYRYVNLDTVDLKKVHETGMELYEPLPECDNEITEEDIDEILDDLEID